MKKEDVLKIITYHYNNEKVIVTIDKDFVIYTEVEWRWKYDYNISIWTDNIEDIIAWVDENIEELYYAAIS